MRSLAVAPTASARARWSLVLMVASVSLRATPVPADDADTEPVVAAEIVFRDHGRQVFLARGLIRPAPSRPPQVGEGLPVIAYDDRGLVRYSQPYHASMQTLLKGRATAAPRHRHLVRRAG